RRERAHLLGITDAARVDGVLAQTVSLAEQQHAAIAQPVGAVVLRIDQRAALACREAEAVLEQHHPLYARKVVRKREQHEIELAFHQLLVQLLRDVLVQEELQAGKRLAQRRQHARQKERRDRRDHAEVERPLERPVLAPRGLGERGELPQAALRTRRDLAAGRGDRDLAVRAVDQVRAEQRLELAYRDAERRLGHVAGCRRASEMAVLGESDEIAQLLDRRQTGRCLHVDQIERARRLQ